MRTSLKTGVFGVVLFCVTAIAFGAEEDSFREIPGLTGFDAVVNSTRAELTIRLGEDYSVRVQGEDAALRRYRFRVADGKLRIRGRWWWWYVFSIPENPDVRIEVTMPSLSSLRVSGRGDATVEGTIRTDQVSLQSAGSGGISVEGAILSDRLRLRTAGSGAISANGQASDLDISMSGSGDIDFSGSCDRADLDLNSSANLHLELEARTVTASISGRGDIYAVGSADDIELTMRSSGRFEGDRFEVRTADIRQTGSGDTLLAVERYLTAHVSGRGDVVITEGSPEIDATTRGSGRVLHRGE
jgi:hypothetical protein